MLSERLKLLRTEKNLLQRDVAKFLKITASAYGFYEQGKRIPDSDMLNRIADFFNVSVDYLLGRTDFTTSINQSKSNLAEQVAIRLIKELEKDGYKIEEKDLPNLILASKITLAQNKKNQDD